MIDFAKDRLLDFPTAAKLLPNGSRPSYATWWRWWRRGVRGVKLETVLVGGKRYTSEAAMRRFIDALSQPPDAGPAASSKSRQRDIRSAEKELAERGV